MFPSPKTDGPIRELQKAVQRLRKRCGFRFIAHDLRRTAATLMADAGVAENIIPKILNHTEPGGTRRHYNLHPYRTEKRAALEKWARYLQAILTGKQTATATVVQFRQWRTLSRSPKIGSSSSLTFATISRESCRRARTTVSGGATLTSAPATSGYPLRRSSAIGVDASKAGYSDGRAIRETGNQPQVAAHRLNVVAQR